jgi:hypothetical protein
LTIVSIRPNRSFPPAIARSVFPRVGNVARRGEHVLVARQPNRPRGREDAVAPLAMRVDERRADPLRRTVMTATFFSLDQMFA